MSDPVEVQVNLKIAGKHFSLNELIEALISTNKQLDQALKDKEGLVYFVDQVANADIPGYSKDARAILVRHKGDE